MKVFFLDLADHRWTHSSLFFQHILKERFDVKLHYATTRHSPDMATPKDVAGYDVVLNWQMAPSVSQARKYAKPMVYVPMYDGETFNPWKWRRIRLNGGRVICFTSKISSFLRKIGFDPLDVRYYIPTKKFVPGDPRKLFLWDRGGVGFQQLKNRIDLSYFQEIIIRLDDRSRGSIDEDDRKRYNIRVVKFDSASDNTEYLRLMSEAGVYVAPRFKEGIGMSFLEAMAMGKCVIGHDDATMSDYIQHGSSGYLIDFKRQDGTPLKLTEDEVVRIQHKTYRAAEMGYERWVRSEESLCAWVRKYALEWREMKSGQFVVWLALAPFQFLWNVRLYFKMRFKIV